jgi:hypothetical protein
VIPLPVKRALDAPVRRMIAAGLRWPGLGEAPRAQALETTLMQISTMSRSFKADIVQYDPHLLWTLKPHAVLNGNVVDERGMMNGPFAMADHKLAKPVRVLFLGASAYIWGEPSLFERVRQRVEAERDDVQLINAGVPGYTVVQHLHWLDRLFPFYRPTHVISSSVWTDCYPRELHDDALIMRIMREPTWRGGAAGDRLGRALLYVRYRLRHSGARVPLGQYRRTWRTLKRYCRRRGVRLGFFYHPVFFETSLFSRFLGWHGIAWLPRRYEKYVKAFERAAASAPLCDCRTVLKGNQRRYAARDGQHLNDKGMRLVTDAMVEFILKDLLSD